MYKVFTLLNFLLIFIVSASGQWKQNEFYLGTWLDPSDSKYNIENGIYVENVRRAADAGFNLFVRGYGFDNLDLLKEKMAVLRENRIKLIYYTKKIESNILNNRENLNILLDSVNNKYSNLLGYFIYDEPGNELSSVVSEFASTIKSYDSSKIAYVNLLPSYGFKLLSEYEEYINYFINDSNIDILSYDFYPFVKHKIIPNYFYNLKLFSENKKNKPFWCYVLTTAHGEYDEPNEYELLFMAFCPLIYGAKGIIYFTYDTSEGSVYNFQPAIINRNIPTKKYYIIGKINFFIKEIAGPIIMNSKLLGTVHVSNSCTNENLDQENLLNDSTPFISTISNTNIAAGIYQSKNVNTIYYLFLQNKSNTSNFVHISLKGNYVDSINISQSYINLQKSRSVFLPLKSAYDSLNHETDFYVDFKPGELRILQLKNVNEVITKKYLNKFSLQVFPNPFNDKLTIKFFLKKDLSININLIDANGSVVQNILTKEKLNKGKHIIDIDTSSIPKSKNYLIAITSDEMMEVSKIIKI